MDEKIVTTKNIIRFLPQFESEREYLLSHIDTFSPDEKFNCERRIWDSFDRWSEDIKYGCEKRILEEINQGIRKRPKNLKGTINRTVEEIVFDFFERGIADEWATNPNRGTWRERWKLLGHKQDVLQVAFSPDGHILASAGGNDDTVRLWDLLSGGEIRHFGLGKLGLKRYAIPCLAYSPDGQLLVTGSNRIICIWDMTDKKREPNRLEGHTDWVTSVTFCLNRPIIASGSDDGTIRLWDTTNNKETQRFEIPLKRKLFADILDKNNKIVDHRYYYIGKPKSIAFSPNGQILASGCDDNIIRLWNINRSFLQKFTGSIHNLKGHWGRVNSIAFSPNGQILASASGDKTVCLWNVASRKQIMKLEGHGGDGVGCVAFSPNGRVLATGGAWGDHSVRLWDITTGKELLIFHSIGARCITFGPNGRYLAAGTIGGSILVWKVEIE